MQNGWWPCLGRMPDDIHRASETQSDLRLSRKQSVCRCWSEQDVREREGDPRAFVPQREYLFPGVVGSLYQDRPQTRRVHSAICPFLIGSLD